MKRERKVKHEINRLRFSCDMITVGYGEGMLLFNERLVNVIKLKIILTRS